MSDLSPILSLPLLQAAQAQKHVTHNEALMRLDLLVQLAVSNRALTSPPPSPGPDARHIVGAAATGAWAGHSTELAYWQDGVWQFLAPLAGWRAWIAEEEALATFDGTAWKTAAEGSLAVGQLGVSAVADATNRLSVSSPATLLNHAGAGHQLKLNKASATDTTSLLFQTGFSGRVELGTAGEDAFSLKVSPDGTAFSTALRVDPSSGIVEIPQSLLMGGRASDPVSPANGQIWFNTTSNQLRANIGGRLRQLDDHRDIPWLIPDAGEWVMTTIGSGGTTTTLAGGANRIDLYPFNVRAEIDLDAMGVNCTTAAAGGQAKLLIYHSDSQGRPDALLLETGTVDLSSTGNKTALCTAKLYQGRTYWVGVRHSSTAVLSAWLGQATPDINGGTSMVTSARKLLRRTVTFSTAAPANWGFSTGEISTGTATAIWLRMA